MDTMQRIREACRLRQWMPDNREFVEGMADIFCAKPLNSDGDNLYHFLEIIYNAGRIEGVRCEQRRKAAHC